MKASSQGGKREWKWRVAEAAGWEGAGGRGRERATLGGRRGWWRNRAADERTEKTLIEFHVRVYLRALSIRMRILLHVCVLYVCVLYVYICVCVCVCACVCTRTVTVKNFQ